MKTALAHVGAGLKLLGLCFGLAFIRVFAGPTAVEHVGGFCDGAPRCPWCRLRGEP